MKIRNPQHGQPVRFINLLPIAIVAGHIMHMIASCRTMAELATCEGLLITWLRDRYPDEAAGRYIPELVALAQVKHVEIQLGINMEQNKKDRSC